MCERSIFTNTSCIVCSTHQSKQVRGGKEGHNTQDEEHAYCGKIANTSCLIMQVPFLTKKREKAVFWILTNFKLHIDCSS
jgi:hypothetical protein